MHNTDEIERLAVNNVTLWLEKDGFFINESSKNDKKGWDMILEKQLLTQSGEYNFEMIDRIFIQVKGAVKHKNKPYPSPKIKYTNYINMINYHDPFVVICVYFNEDYTVNCVKVVEINEYIGERLKILQELPKEDLRKKKSLPMKHAITINENIKDELLQTIKSIVSNQTLYIENKNNWRQKLGYNNFNIILKFPIHDREKTLSDYIDFSLGLKQEITIDSPLATKQIGGVFNNPEIFESATINNLKNRLNEITIENTRTNEKFVLKSYLYHPFSLFKPEQLSKEHYKYRIKSINDDAKFDLILSQTKMEINLDLKDYISYSSLSDFSILCKAFLDSNVTDKLVIYFKNLIGNNIVLSKIIVNKEVQSLFTNYSSICNFTQILKAYHIDLDSKVNLGFFYHQSTKIDHIHSTLFFNTPFKIRFKPDEENTHEEQIHIEFNKESCLVNFLFLNIDGVVIFTSICYLGYFESIQDSEECLFSSHYSYVDDIKNFNILDEKLILDYQKNQLNHINKKHSNLQVLNIRDLLIS